MTGANISRRTALAGLAGAAASLGAPAIVRAATQRVVSIGAETTEIMFALGRGGEIVATDAASVYPAAAGSLPKLGFHRALVADDVLALRPDLVIAGDGAGPAEALEAIAAAGVRIVRVPEPRRLADIPERIHRIAEATGETPRGLALADGLAADLAVVGEAVKHVGERRRALVLLGAPEGHALVAAGRGSTAAFALELAGAENAAPMLSGWGAIAPRAVQEIDPEAVVALAVRGRLEPQRVVAAPALKGTAAVREGRIAVVDALGFVGFGPRAAHAIHAVTSRIYPELGLAPLPGRDWAPLETAAL